MDVGATLPIAPKPEEGVGGGEDGNQEGEEEDGRRGGRKRDARVTPVKKSRSFGGKNKKAKSSASGQAFSSAACKMEKAKEEAKAKANDDASFRQVCVCVRT